MSEIWNIYVVPILIAILGIYANNSCTMYSIRREIIHKCLINIHDIKRLNIDTLVNKSTKYLNKNYFNKRSAINENEFINDAWVKLYDLFDDLMLYVYSIRMRISVRTYVVYLINIMCKKDINPFFEFLINWRESELIMNDKMTNEEISNTIKLKFKKDKLSITQINTSLSTFNSNLNKLKNVLILINHKHLVLYGIEEPFLGNTTNQDVVKGRSRKERRHNKKLIKKRIKQCCNCKK